jgi:hypothetical protein
LTSTIAIFVAFCAAGVPSPPSWVRTAHFP